LKEESTQFISLFRFVDLRKYGVQTSTLLLDGLGIGLVNATGDALEISIRGSEGGAFSVAHTLMFSSLVLCIGYTILHVTELLRVRITPEEDDSLGAQMQRFLFVLSSRACTYLGGFVMQLSLAEWIIETHAEIMLGKQRAHEAIASVNATMSVDDPFLPDIPPLDTVKVAAAHAGSHVAHSLVLLKEQVLNATLTRSVNKTSAAMHAFHDATTKIEHQAEDLLHNDHLRFEATLIVAFAGFALLVTIVGVGLSMITQQISEKYEERLVLWKMDQPGIEKQGGKGEQKDAHGKVEQKDAHV
jgi:hypothetical protein